MQTTTLGKKNQRMMSTAAAVNSEEAQRTASSNAPRRGKVLISVSDKAGIVDLAKGLVELGYEIVSTGGSYRALSEGGVAVSQVREMTENDSIASESPTERERERELESWRKSQIMKQLLTKRVVLFRWKASQTSLRC